MNDLIERLQKTDRCYCGSEVIDGELQLVACLFHQAADALEQKDIQIEDLEEVLFKIVALADKALAPAGDCDHNIKYGRVFPAQGGTICLGCRHRLTAEECGI